MDDAENPVRVPPQMITYAEEHNIFNLMKDMLTSLVIDQPEDPITYMITLLKRDKRDVPRVLLLGPPGVGKRSVVSLLGQLSVSHILFLSVNGTNEEESDLRDAERLSVELTAVHVSAESLLQGSSEVLVEQITQRLKETDCFNRGWVLEGFPQTRLQARSLTEAGVLPDHVVMLEAPHDVLLRRIQGRLVDPLTGDVYHETFIWPDDPAVTQHLVKPQSPTERQRLADLHCYRCEVTGLTLGYQHVLKVINADQPLTDIIQQALAFVQTRHRRITPRIILLGPPGSGKSHQARILSEKYKMVDVCCGQLLRSVAGGDSDLGKEIQPYLDAGRPVPNSLVLRVVEERLSRLDCSNRGWILHGFPRDLQQAKSLREAHYIHNKVFVLELTDDVCLERISLRATDPVSGERFHAVARPAPSSEVQNRLQTRPEDRPGAVTDALRQYRKYAEALQSVYPDAVHIDADQDPHSVFVALESRLTVY